ncbi:Coq4 family protein [Enhygromyxa salina]|uniref:Coenzyme Q (Ubiquinone) biosynthesis protein Coq4 n=1 Tax=Enhygromyxa salina TaxID=215803 RepID=A0A2S9YFF5_9BACT|nr:Coq4 family protein [Enhygromyxa salina]PRQ03771.1 Coenzyme Q (ubiquinone) biosynthesis protein Coq4 [Enhygromyxa salina]
MSELSTLELLRKIREAQANPALIGDVPVYKGELSRARARPEVEAQLDRVRGYAPPVELDALAQLPDGTLGREYLRFLQSNDLHPITLTGNCDPEMVARNAFTVRYAIIHDMVHVLTGFDASWPGEVGVWAVVGGQNYSRGFRVAAFMALVVAPLRCPLRLGEAWRSFRRGWRIGKQAKLLVAIRLEEHFARPLDQLRAELGVVLSSD